MKPKKGETNNEMDEPMRNPLQLVKDLVLLIVEARTPDFTVKGRIEGPHCPIIRGRPAHKCSADKVECGRANEFCCLAQRLWLNSIPVCLDILLFPDCIHGWEEASVTEGAVAKLSQENVLLVERWTIDWTKRRQDDCLSSSMLIQAVRSYLHFSQISSWLFSTCGRLPGRLAYRVYAPGEVTSLDFPHPPDIHSFPVCLVNFHPIRVKVSSLQRQASVPILVCHQPQTVGDNSRDTLYRKNSQGKRAKVIKAKTKQEHLRTFVSGTCFKGGPSSSEQLQTTDPFTMGYSISARTAKGDKKSVKSLHPLGTSSPLLCEDQVDDMYGSSCAVTNPFTFTKTGNIFNHFEETDISSAGFSAGKATGLARMMISDGGDDVEAASDVISRMYSVPHGSDMNTSFSAFSVGTSDLLIKKLKSPRLKMEQGLFSQGLFQGANSKKGYAFLSDINREWDTGDQKRLHARAVNKVGETGLHSRQMRTGFQQNTHERKVDKHFDSKDEYANQQTYDDPLIFTKSDEVVDCCKFPHQLHREQPRMQTQLEMIQATNTRKLLHSFLGNEDVEGSDGKKWPSNSSPGQMFQDGHSVNQIDLPVSFGKAGMKSKLQTKFSNSSQKEAIEDETLIQILSDKLPVVMATNKGMSASSAKLNAELKATNAITGNSGWRSLLENEDTEAAGLCEGRDKLTPRHVKACLDQNAEFSQLTVDISKLPDTFEDSDNTPVASPNQTPKSRSVPETFMKSLAAASLKHNLYWLQKDVSYPAQVETPLESVDASIENSDHELWGEEDNVCVKEGALIDKCSACNKTPEQSSCRRMFEENLLPLVSYDADSDSFRKVDDFLSCSVLHSPKVLFSCDLPNTKLSSSRKCIDFSDTFETEFFRSKMTNLVDPEAIGKYMSKLALLSNSSSNGREDQGHTGDKLDAGRQFDDLIGPDVTSNAHMSSNTECLPEQKREVQDAQTWTDSTHLHSASSHYFITPDCFSRCDLEGQPDKIVHEEDSFTVQQTSNDNILECLVSRDGFPQTRRQLNYFDVENSQLALSIRTNKHENVIETSAALELLSDCDNTPQHHIQNQEECQDQILSEVAGFNGTVISYLSEKIALQTSPPLSSSCSSSSSSSSVSSVQMRTVPLSALSPAVLAPTNAHKILHSEKDCENSASDELNVKEPMFICSSLASDNPSDELVDENPSRTTSIRTLNTEKLHPDLKSNLISFSNAESTIPSFCASVSIPLVSAISTSSLSSLNSASSISLHSLPASIHLIPQIQNDATQANLCHIESSRTPSLLNDSIPQPSSQGYADFDNGWSLYAKPESTSNDLKLIMSDFMCNQNIYVHDQNSQRISTTKSVQHVPNLIQEQEYTKHLCDVQVATHNSLDQQKYVSSSKNHGIEDTTYQSVLDCCSSLDTVTTQDTNIGQECSLTDSTKSTYYPHNGSGYSGKHHVAADDSAVAKARIRSNNKVSEVTELCSVSLEAVTDCETSSSKVVDSLKRRFHKSTIPMLNGDITSLRNETCSIDFPNKLDFRSKEECASKAVNPLIMKIISDDSSFSQKQSDPFLKETNTLQRDLGFETGSQSAEECHDVFHPSFVNPPLSRYTSTSNQETNGAEQSSDACWETDLGTPDQNENMHLQNPSLKIIETGIDSKKCFHVEDTDTSEEKNISDSNWDNDVVFYLSEPETMGKIDQPMSAVSNLWKEVTSSETCKAIRPSSLSAEVNLEIKLRSSFGIKDKTDLEFSAHSRSPPFLSDPPGWNSVPPHRTVSTPSGMDRESRMKEERTSANISVIQQQNCDNVSQTGLQRMAAKSASMIFNNRTGLPTQSSPAPLKRKSGGRFEYDVSLLSSRAIKTAFSCSKLASAGDNNSGDQEEKKKHTLSTSAPASTNCLLGNFEESILNGRIDPVGTVDGFTAEIGASGSFCPKHIYLPVSAFFFALSDDNAPSPYLGYINLDSIGKKGYHIPKKGTVQVTLFNPNKMVVKMFVVVYDLSDMPVSSQTFIRQRTVYSPVDKNHPAPSYLRYLIHLRCASSQSGKIYLHTDIRLIFARQKLDIDAKTIPYELKSYTEGPQNPKYSPKK
ncbi:hypothetical protein BsWGS_16630 [Bradybaena similaris]